jgi:hypothetical protein
MIIAANHKCIFVFIVRAHRKVLAAEVHISRERKFAFVINYVAFLARNRYISFLPAYEQEFVIRNIKGLEVPWDVMLGQLVIISKFKLSEISLSLNEIEYLERVRVEGR